MIKLIIFMLYGLGVLFINRFTEENVTSSIEVPSHVEAGGVFTVDVVINKGMIDGFSRFQQAIPAGLRASAVETDQSDFRFEENKVKFLWFNLPQREQLTLSYQVEVDQRLKGAFVIDGSFAYIENNERRSVRVRSHSIEINPSDEIDPRLIVDINDFERLITPELRKGQVAAIRQRPQREQDGGAIVNILVSKQDRGKFAKIEESIPSGFIAEPVETQRGIFTSRGNSVKFLWMDLPEADNFIVSYRLTPRPEAQTPTGAINIQGAFSYIEGRETVSVGIQQRDVDVTKLSPQQIQALLEGEEVEMGSAQRIPVVPAQLRAQVEDEKSDDAISDAVVAEQKEAKQETAQPTRPEDALPVNDLARFAADDQSDVSYVLQPETGIYYRVQLAAGHRPVRIDDYFGKYNLSLEVKRERHEGWYKYSVGSFKVYREARDYRVQVWTTTPIDDAFVAAYNDGQRITVQEALMISNQKWYR